eukprot:16616-Heterococcus_DN1.PRE.3
MLLAHTGSMSGLQRAMIKQRQRPTGCYERMRLLRKVGSVLTTTVLNSGSAAHRRNVVDSAV